MKRFFIAYRHTGENLMELEQRLNKIEIALATHKIKAYATLSEEEEFVKDRYSAGQIMERAFQKIASMDGLFVLIHSNDKSEGQLMEVGYAIAIKKPIIVAYQQDVKTYVPELANKSVAYKDIDDLVQKIKELEL